MLAPREPAAQEMGEAATLNLNTLLANHSVMLDFPEWFTSTFPQTSQMAT